MIDANILNDVILSYYYIDGSNYFKTVYVNGVIKETYMAFKNLKMSSLRIAYHTKNRISISYLESGFRFRTLFFNKSKCLIRVNSSFPHQVCSTGFRDKRNTVVTPVFRNLETTRRVEYAEGEYDSTEENLELEICFRFVKGELCVYYKHTYAITSTNVYEESFKKLFDKSCIIEELQEQKVGSLIL